MNGKKDTTRSAPQYVPPKEFQAASTSSLTLLLLAFAAAFMLFALLCRLTRLEPFFSMPFDAYEDCEFRLFCLLLEVASISSGTALVRFDVFCESFGSAGACPAILGGAEEVSATGMRSVRPLVGGLGKEMLAPLEAVRRRRCEDMSCEEVDDFTLSGGASMIPVSINATSALSLLVSLLATLTLMSRSYALRPGVIGDGRGDAWSVVAVSTGEDCGNGSSGENSEGVGRWCGIAIPGAGESCCSDQTSLVELSRSWLGPLFAS
jgi:hypothetical protein